MLRGAMMMRGKSPWLAPKAWLRSPCSVLVGTPVDGPARITLMATTGVSMMPAMPMASVIREPASGRGAHAADAHVVGADGHVDDRDFVLDLADANPQLFAVRRHPVQDAGSRTHRIGTVEFAIGHRRRHG